MPTEIHLRWDQEAVSGQPRWKSGCQQPVPGNLPSYICVCVLVCTYVHKYSYFFTVRVCCVRICIDMFVYVCMCVHTSMCVHVYTYVCVYVCKYVQYVCVDVFMCKYMYCMLSRHANTLNCYSHFYHNLI